MAKYLDASGVTHLTEAYDLRYVRPTGTASQYIAGDGTFKTMVTDTNTWRPIKYGSTTLNDRSTTLTFANGSGISMSFSSGTLTISNTYSYTLPVGTQTVLGGIKPWMVHTAASTYNGGTTAPTSNNTVVNVVALSTTTGRYYAVEMDNVGRAFVNVPWTDTNTNTWRSIKCGAATLSDTSTALTFVAGEGVSQSLASGSLTTAIKVATSSTLGGIKIGYTASGKNYPVVLDSNNQAYVNVPWTDTNTIYTLPIASTTAIGGVKVGRKATSAVSGFTTGTAAAAPTVNALTTTAGKYYVVECDSAGLMYVNVPWQNTNTTYTFTNTSKTLSWGGTTTLLTVSGGASVAVQATMPTNPVSKATIEPIINEVMVAMTAAEINAAVAAAVAQA